MKRTMKIYRQPKLLLAFHLLCSSIVLTAQESGDEFIRIALAAESDTDSPLAGIITDSMSFEFYLQDMDLLLLEPDDLKSLLKTGDKEQCSYLVTSTSVIGEEEVGLQLKCIRIRDGFELYERSFTTPVDLTLDQQIQKEVSAMVALIQQDRADNPELTTLLKNEIPQEEPEPSVIPEAPRKRPVRVSAGGALFIPVGKTADYFKMGALPWLQGHLLYDLPFGRLGAGFSLTLNILQAAGEANKSKNLFFTAGPEGMFILDLNKSLSLFAGLDGGVALLMIDMNDEGYQGFAVPYVSPGAGVFFGLKDWMGIRAEISSIFYFEESLTISGLIPRIGLYFNL